MVPAAMHTRLECFFQDFCTDIGAKVWKIRDFHTYHATLWHDFSLFWAYHATLVLQSASGLPQALLLLLFLVFLVKCCFLSSGLPQAPFLEEILRFSVLSVPQAF